MPLKAIAGSFRRHGGDGSLDRPRARNGWRLLVRPEPVQSRHASLPAARLVVQADRVFLGARQWLYAVDGGGGRPDRNRPGAGRRRLASGELFKWPLSGADDPAKRAAAVAEHRDGAAGAGYPQSLGQLIRAALRRLRRNAET